MINNIPKPKISSNFTVDDIHKIREWHYECLKDASFEEYTGEVERVSGSFMNRVSKFKEKNMLV